MTAPIFPNYAVENNYRNPVLLSLNYVPGLPNSFTGGAKVRNPTRKRRPAFEMSWIPPPHWRSGRPNVLETPSGSECAHCPRPEHMNYSDRAQDQRNHCNNF